MLKPFEERKEHHTKNALKLIESEKRVEALLTHLGDIAKESVSTHSPYWDSSHILFLSKDMFITELELIPLLSKTFGIKWDKTIHSSVIDYFSWFRINGHTFYFRVELTPEGTCTFKKRATGRVIQQHKLVDVPEYEYIVDCSEEDNNA
jgi:hypothetical protein